MNTFEEYGYTSKLGDTRLLIADLTPPLYHGSEVAIECLQHGAELWSSDCNFTYKWDIETTPTQNNIQLITASERVTYTIPNINELKIHFTLQNRGDDTNHSLDLNFNCQTGAYSSFWKQKNSNKAIVELIQDLKPYIEDAAKFTGTKGVTARFIASVLYIEISNRPKSDRQDEIEEVAEEILELTFQRHRKNFFDMFNTNFFLHKSFGVGQMKMSTLAMALGMIPLIEHDRENNSPTVKKIKESFMKLSTDQMWYLWKIIRWPKSHIYSVAKLLSFLKNRNNRYPKMLRNDFKNNYKAMAIVATEYNRGATNTPESNAGPTWYGEKVANICENSLEQPELFYGFSNE